MGPASLQDSDGDGLPDLAEDIVGTRANARDSNGDGIDDLTSLGLGINPTGDSIFPSGVLGATTLRGNADSVAVAPAAANPAGLTAYVATGNYGLAVVDVSRFNTPTVRAELDLPGDNTDVAIDSARSLALVAAGSAGLHIVDVSQASAPVLRQTVVFPQAVNAVAARDGLAYVADGSSLAIVSVSTGEVLQTLDLGNTGGTTIQSLAIEGNTLYSVDSSHLLRSFHIDGSLLTARGTLTLPSSGRLFVGGGVAYIGASGAIGGFITADVRDPAAMSLLSGVDNTSVGGTAVVANGSGLAITVGSVPGPQGQAQYMVDVLNVADPSNTGKFITRYSLPQVPADLALAMAWPSLPTAAAAYRSSITPVSIPRAWHLRSASAWTPAMRTATRPACNCWKAIPSASRPRSAMMYRYATSSCWSTARWSATMRLSRST
jgi:hypothetical protein